VWWHDILAYANMCSMQTQAMCKAFANEERLRIILCLSRAHSVSDLQKGCTLSQSALSQHLRVLRDARVVECARSGKQVLYRLRSRKALTLAKLLLDYAKS